MPVIEALESGITLDLPTGSYTMHGPSHHCIKDVSIARIESNEFKIIETFKKQMPESAEVCDLFANPDENQQFQPKI